MFRPCAIFLCATALASAALAQNLIFIASPSAGSDVTAGKNITVQLGENAQIDGAGISIGINPCTSASECPGPGQGIGQVIYFGTYNPKQYKDKSYPYENITVAIPPLHDGPYLLAVAGYFPSGVSNGYPPLLYTSTEVMVVGSN